MILMNDFKKEYQFHQQRVDKAIQDVLESGYYILGNQTKAFEQEFASYTGTNYAIGVANGLEALQIALLAIGVGDGDEVITVSNSAVATALAISMTGATPVFVDVDAYHHMDVDAVENAITRRTKAIIPVHLYGQPVDMHHLDIVANRHNIPVIEDACQAHGGHIGNTRVGAFGLLAAFSFYPTKNLGTYGDGGAITTSSKELYDKCVMLRNYGQKNRYVHELKGVNSRLDELHAAILRVKLETLDDLISKRRNIAALYRQKLASVSQIQLPKERSNTLHTYHLFVIEAENRDALQQYLKENGVESLIHYPIPIHKQTCFPEFNSVHLPRTEALAKSILSLPIHPFLTEHDAETVSTCIQSFYAK